MTNKQRTKGEPSKGLVMNASLAQMPESDLVELFGNIERLRAVLYRFVLLDSESVEVVTRSQAALKTIRDEISRVLAFHHTQNCGEQVQNWGNEGGRVEYASV